MERPIREQFAEDGFAVLRGVVGPSDVAFYIRRLRELAGTAERWTEPDGVNRNSEFWPVVFNERVLAAMRQVLGPSVRYLPHSDLHVGFSSFSWHRDSVTRRFGDGADWDETSAPYRIARVGIYLQSYADSGFRLGFVKGSHRLAGLSATDQRRIERRTSAAANVLSGLDGKTSVGIPRQNLMSGDNRRPLDPR